MDNFAFYTDKEKKLKELRSNEEKIEIKPGAQIIGPFAFRTPNAKEIKGVAEVQILSSHSWAICLYRIFVLSLFGRTGGYDLYGCRFCCVRISTKFLNILHINNIESVGLCIEQLKVTYGFAIEIISI